MATMFRLLPILLALLLGAPVSARTACPATFAGGAEPKLTNTKLEAATRVLCFRAFAALHSGVTRTPLWSAEHLTRASVEAAQKRDIRDNGFHPEDRLPDAERAELADYRSSGYDRGHMAPSGDTGDDASDRETFSLANMVPQLAVLNRNGWSRLESYVRSLTLKLGETYVVTGPLYEGTSLKRVGGRVLVPSSVWKAIWVPGQGAGAWIATNAAKPRWQVASVAQLMAKTGIDPFPTMDAATRAKVPAFPDFGSARQRTRRR